MSETRKVRGLYLNQPGAQCSIYESGLMVYRALQGSALYDLAYFELTPESASKIPSADFYLLNYHHATMAWLNTASVRGLPGKVMTVVLEMLPGNPFVYVSPEHFDAYVVLDPTIRIDHPSTYAFPRPLEGGKPNTPYVEKEIPWIGTFGFSTPGKGFEQVVEAVNREFDRALVRINIPVGTFADGHAERYHRRPYGEYLAELCQRVAKPGIEVQVTRDFLSKEQLIEWCAQNTLNCFLYCRNQPGLSATTDQCVTAGRPLAVSANETFRHLHQYIRPYPERSLRESIACSMPEVDRMRVDWTPTRFMERFEEVLRKSNVLEADAPIRVWTPPAPRENSTITWSSAGTSISEFLKGDALQNTLTRSRRWTIVEQEGAESRAATSADLTIIPLYCNEHPLPEHTRVGIFLFREDAAQIERGLRALVESGAKSAHHPLAANTEVAISIVGDQSGPGPLLPAEYEKLATLCSPWTIALHRIPAEPQSLLSLMAQCSVLVCIDPTTHLDVLFHYALGTQRPVATIGDLSKVPEGFPTSAIRLEESPIADILSRGIAPLVSIYNDWSEARAVLQFEASRTRSATTWSHTVQTAGEARFNRVLTANAANDPIQMNRDALPHLVALSRLVQDLSETQLSVNELQQRSMSMPAFLPKTETDARTEHSRHSEDYLFESVTHFHKQTQFRRGLLVHTGGTALRTQLETLGIAVDEIDPTCSYTLDQFYQQPTTICGHYDLIVVLGGAWNQAESQNLLRLGVPDRELFFAELGELLAISGKLLMTCWLQADTATRADGALPVTARSLIQHYLTAIENCRLLDTPEWQHTRGEALISLALEKLPRASARNSENASPDVAAEARQ